MKALNIQELQKQIEHKLQPIRENLVAARDRAQKGLNELACLELWLQEQEIARLKAGL